MPATGQASGAPPRRPTLRDVAARAEVSASTASLAFAGDARVAPPTRERVLAAAAELGYPGPDPLARSLRQGRSGVVGAVVGERLGYAFADPFAVATLDGLAEEVGALGSALLLLSGGEDDDRRLARVAHVPVDAVVYATCGGPADPAVDLLLRRGVPVVGIEGPRAPGVHLVDVDNRGSSADLARELVRLGHRRVAVATLPWRLDGRRGPLDAARRCAAPGYDDARLRLLGVEDVLAPSGVWECAGNQREEGALAARALLADGAGRPLPPGRRPTALVAQSDLLAVGAVLAAQELGLRVPQDVSVAGYDGIETPWLGGAVLTTVEQPAAEKGRAAGRMVAALLRGESPPDVDLPVRLRRGTTTGPPPL
ncbi:LacI family DNA-binding transcriptional regulator [Quadrisphaera sp. DSM 44207]|uniref:LacI family DNA-binding transcriptional regulator n=1 Tax=Quadrisphaera sp. DSM 44207 TaxID=1881057 RepID=UPI000891C555|nr:LacI family DNA-binding transcriptional regulator [Quadrisphaera sp. DSM 44207]SDQ14898.1 transcriptional regulator, LacI family [Quadrisphaera sp. DSM 44207]